MRTTILLMILLMLSCKSVKYIPVETTETKTEHKGKESKDSTVVKEVVNTRDSVVFRDSVVYTYNDKGELLSKEIWHWKERYRDKDNEYHELKAKYDSLNVAKRDSIRVPYPIEVIKEKYRVPRSLWWLVILLAGLSVPSILKILRKLKLIKI
nr:MAG TPA: Ribosome associated membrane protein RAMP4 [Caudoviricetes sp.]